MFEKVEIYSKSNCIFCDKAKHLFNSMNIEYVEHNAEDQATFTELMERNPAARTMPQIFINDQLIGGFTDLELKVSKPTDKLVIDKNLRHCSCSRVTFHQFSKRGLIFSIMFYILNVH